MEPADAVAHVDGDADGTALLAQAPGDRLPDPPCGKGCQLVAPLVIELVHRLHQAHVACLDEIHERQSESPVFLGDTHHQAGVGRDEMLAGLFSLFYQPFQSGPFLRVMTVVRQLVPGLASLLQAFGQFDLLLAGQKGHVAHLLEVQTDAVAGADAAQVRSATVNAISITIQFERGPLLSGCLLAVVDLNTLIVESGKEVL